LQWVINEFLAYIPVTLFSKNADDVAVRLAELIKKWGFAFPPPLLPHALGI
jgi:hypothetical protein